MAEIDTPTRPSFLDALMGRSGRSTHDPRGPARPHRRPPMSTAARGEPIDILLVEDSPDDADLTKDALRNGKVHNNISHVEDGGEAMAFLRRQGRHADAPRPDLVLLDLNLPR